MKKAIRKYALHLFELFTRHRGVIQQLHDEKIRVPARFYHYFPKDYEAANFEFMNEHVQQDMTCIDVGAHLGLYAVYLAKKYQSQVYSFEPTPTTRQFLEKTIALNGLGNRITVFSEAVSSSSGQGDFFLNHSQKKKDDPMAIAEANALQTRITIPTIVTTAIPVKTISLDDFSLDHPGNIGFIKIDAEGSELEVLRGARKIFLQHRPYAIVGMHSFFYENIPATLNDFWTLMQEYHYDIFYNSQPLTLAGLLELKINELFDLQLKPR